MASRPFRALVKNSLQRFDIKDHKLLGDAMFHLSQEQYVGLTSDDGVGRVFAGYNPTFNGSAVTVTAGVAVNSAGQFMVLHTAKTVTPALVNNKVYGVYAYVTDEETDTEARRQWAGTSEVAVDVFTRVTKTIALGVVEEGFSGSFTVSSLFPATVGSDTILPIAAVTVDGSGTKTLYDCRSMFVVDGNVSTGIGLPAETHDFSNVKTRGVTSIRTFLRGITNRVKAITGASQWWSDPAITLASSKSRLDGHDTDIDNLVSGYGEGSRALRRVDNYADLRQTSPYFRTPSVGLTDYERCVVIVKDRRAAQFPSGYYLALYVYDPSITSDLINDNTYVRVALTPGARPSGATTGGWRLLALPNGELLDGVVTNDSVVSGAITNDKIADGTIDNNKLSRPCYRGTISVDWTSGPALSPPTYADRYGLVYRDYNIDVSLDKLIFTFGTATYFTGVKVTFSTPFSSCYNVVVSPAIIFNDSSELRKYHAFVVPSHEAGFGLNGDYKNGFYVKFFSMEDGTPVELFNLAIGSCTANLNFEVYGS